VGDGFDDPRFGAPVCLCLVQDQSVHSLEQQRGALLNVMLGVVFGAQPADIKRTRIIVVVRLNLGTTAHFTGLF
jgi:hypothetical protein